MEDSPHALFQIESKFPWEYLRCKITVMAEILLENIKVWQYLYKKDKAKECKHQLNTIISL